MITKSIFLHTDAFARFEAYKDYPWLFGRSEATLELCRRHNLFDKEGVEIHKPKKASVDALRAYHMEAYLKVLKQANRGESKDAMLAYGLGTLECAGL